MDLITIITFALVFIFGSIIGSFLNVVIYRYNSGTSPFVGRSQCFSCGKILTPRDLVPIVSFLVTKGRCANCKVRLSWQYPLVEALTGAIFVAVFLLQVSVVETVILLAIFSILLVVAVYDIRHQIIPDGLSFLFAMLGLILFFSSIPFFQAFHFPHVWTLIAGPMLFFPFWFLWFISQGRWLGLGDGKLALGIGWFLGATLGASAIMLAFWLGAGYALTAMAIQKIAIAVSASQKVFMSKTRTSWFEVLKSKVNAPAFLSVVSCQLSVVPLSLKSEIPFGPFLIIAVFIVYFTGMNLFDGSFNLFNFL